MGNTEKIQLLEGQYSEVEVRSDAAKMNCQALQHNLKATQEEIKDWVDKREKLESEIAEMDEFGDDDVAGSYVPPPAPEPEPEPEAEPEAEEEPEAPAEEEEEEEDEE